MAAYYLNRAKEWGKEVVIVRKQDDLPLDFSIDDLEKSRKNRLEEKSWMTDETISDGSWCYTEDLRIKPTKDVVHVLIDIVSKNGVLLLNVSPKSDGTIPPDQQKVLLEMGQWLDRYGESIYDTRPWYTFGEGPTKEPEGNFKNHRAFLKIKYSAKDVRYTTKGESIYVTFLGWPESGKVLLKSFSKSELPETLKIKSIKLLGSEETVKWKLNSDGLSLDISEGKVSEIATVFKIDLKK
ncbi:MAG: alpha-L-fucosidase [Cyclobacteriaceae bacterium]